jgi:thioredoxin reductase (NADPH)
MRASKVMQERVKNNEKIEILFHREGKEILGNGQVMTGIKIYNSKDNEETEIEAGGLFYAIGHIPNT